MLKVEKITKSFGGVKAVNNCSFEVKKGLITALIGPNGSGKSTVFNIISKVVTKDSGTVIFDGIDISNYSIEKISNIGMSRLFQKSQLFNNLSVEDNLLLAIDNKDTNLLTNILGINRITKEKRALVDKMLDLVEMKHSKKMLGKELSYGQKRLVEIVRTIINPHKFLMFDEPVAGVNPKLREKISKLFINLKKDNQTLLLIEHDMNFVFDIADEIIVLDEGGVIAQGTPKQIKNNKKVIDIYLGDD